MNYISIILARGGSKGIPNKNLKKVGKYSLIERSIILCKKNKNIKKIYVSTDSKKIAKAALKAGAIIINRPVSLAGDKVSSEDCWVHCIKKIKEKNYFIPDRILFVQCTSPFIRSKDIDKCFVKYEKQKLDCCFSAVKDHSFLWKKSKSGYVGVNHKYKLPRVRRQDLQNIYKETGAFYLVNTVKFVKKKNRFCGKLGLVEVENSVDIDNKTDLEISQYLAIKYENL